MLPVMVADMGAGRRPRQARPINLLTGQRLEYVGLGTATALSFTGGCQVFIETVAHLNRPGCRIVVEPGENPSDVFATLLGDVVRAARTRDSGELEICFSSGSELVVGVDPEFESWAVAGPQRFLIVCLARGELAVWGDAATDPAIA
jgi:hypothetical protein